VILLLIYVNNIFITGNCQNRIQTVKNQLLSQFKMTDLGEIKKYLGVQFSCTTTGLVLHQSNYCHQILDLFDMTHCRPASLPLPNNHQLELKTDTAPVNVQHYYMLVGKLLFLAITRPDILFAVGLLSHYMSRPQEVHLNAALHVLRYLKGTSSYGLSYSYGNSAAVQGFTDTDWGMCKDTFQSTGSYVFTMAGAAISWVSKHQHTVSLSSTKAEYKALTQGSEEATWLKRLLQEIAPVDGQVIHLKCKNILIVSCYLTPHYRFTVIISPV
jgi:hypothetical protein